MTLINNLLMRLLGTNDQDRVFYVMAIIVGMFGIFYPLSIDCKTAITLIPNTCEYEKIILTAILLIPMIFLTIRNIISTDKIQKESTK